MKKSLLITWLGILHALSLNAQKWDYQWPLGYDAEIPGVPDIGVLDFNSQLVKVDTFIIDVTNFGIGASGSFICDKETGQVLLMTNGCEIYDAGLQLVPGSDTLSPGPIYELNCIGNDDYSNVQSIIILPELTNDSVFYVLHKDVEVSTPLQDALSYHFYMTTVVRKADNSFHVSDKRLLMDVPMTYGKLTACANHDGTRWWAWVVGYNTNVFYKFLVGGPDTVQGPFEQAVGDVLYNKKLGIAQAAFSPDTRTLALNADDKKVKVYDFDNESGELSNFREISYPNDTAYARGLVFSPNSRFIYLTSVSNLYQLDLQDNSVDHIAYHLSFDEDNWPVTIGYLLNGPDCRIYADAGSTTYYVHVIHQPNEKGANCMFQARALKLPANQNHEFPNLPMYRFDGACDSSIVFPVSGAGETVVEEALGIKIVPNPASSQVSVLFHNPIATYCTWQLHDQLGRTVRQTMIPVGIKEVQIDLGGLTNGLYFWFILTQYEPIGSGKLIISN